MLKPTKKEAAEMRVRVAKDVLRLVRDGKLVPDHLYFHTSIPHTDCDDAQQVIRESTTCRVCGIGAAAAAYILRHNNATVGDLQGRLEITRLLRPWFSGSMLVDMEEAFENGDWHQALGDHDAAVLRAIMNNIIRNEGEFDPTEYRKGQHLEEDK